MLWPDKLLVVLIAVAAPAPLPFAAAFVWRGDLASQAEMVEKMMLRLFEEAGSIVSQRANRWPHPEGDCGGIALQVTARCASRITHSRKSGN